MDKFEERLVRSEMRLDQHEKQLNTLHQDFKTMNSTLNNILRSINQLKFLGIGAIGVLVIQQIGIFEILKKMIF